MPVVWSQSGLVGRAALVALFAVNVSGCATVADLGGVPRPGYQKDGSYVLTADEQSLGCRELQERQLSLQEQLQQLPSKAVEQMQELPKTVVDAWGRLVGSESQGVPALAQYNEAKAEAVAVNDSLQRKGCGSAVETAAIKH